MYIYVIINKDEALRAFKNKKDADNCLFNEYGFSDAFEAEEAEVYLDKVEVE